MQFVEDDYRNISGKCDAFVSVGMLEHVGVRHYRDLGGVIHRCLKPAGRGLIHTIGRNAPCPTSAWLERRIFPGAYMPGLREIMGVFEPWDFSVLDVENLRLHYASTLAHWLARFDAAAGRVREMFDERFVPRLAIVPGRLSGRVHDRVDSALSDPVCPLREQRRPLDEGTRVRRRTRAAGKRRLPKC